MSGSHSGDSGDASSGQATFKLNDVNSNDQAIYNEGSDVNISCTATGKPDRDVRWTHGTSEEFWVQNSSSHV